MWWLDELFISCLSHEQERMEDFNALRMEWLKDWKSTDYPIYDYDTQFLSYRMAGRE